MTNNPFHGFESYKIPNLFQNPGSTSAPYPAYNPSSLAACRSTRMH